MADKLINIKLATVTESLDGKGAVVLKKGQRVTVQHTDADNAMHLREYEGDGTSTLTALVAAGRYRPAKKEVEQLAQAATETPVDKVLVAGAGNTFTNGLYDRNDSAYIGSFSRMGGSPIYAFGAYVVVRHTSGVWHIYHAGNSETQYLTSTSVANPWSPATWTADQGAAPVPTVTQGGQNLADALNAKLDKADTVAVPAPLKVPKADGSGVLHAGWMPGKVTAVATANVDLSSMPAAIDGHTMANGELFLAAAQTAPGQNGVYTYNGSGNAATRAAAYGTFNAMALATVAVAQGNANQMTLWFCSTLPGGTLDSDALNWFPLPTGVVRLNAQTGTVYTLALQDGWPEALLTQSNGSAITTTVPPNSDVKFPVGTVVSGVQAGDGQVTLTPGSGVMLTAADGALKTAAKGAPWTMVKTGTDTWLVWGLLTT